VLSHGLVATFAQRIMGRLQTVFAVANILLIIATFIVLPVGRRGAGERNDGAYIFGQTANLTTWPIGWAWFLSWLSPIWTIGAFDSCVHISEEAKNATLAVPLGIMSAIGLCWFLGTLCMIVIAGCMSQDLESLIGSPFGQPMAQIYYDAVGKNGAMVMITFMFCVQWLMGVSILVAASRQTFAFSRDGALPFASFFRYISKRLGYIPVRTIWGCVFTTLILGLLCLIAPAAASALFSLAVTGNNLAWFVPIFARIMWGREKFVPGPFYTGKWSIPIAITACVYLVFATILAMMPSGGPNPTPQTMNYAVVINGAVWGGSLLYYFIDARKWFVGPKITLDAGHLTKEQEEKLAEQGLDIKGVEEQRRQSEVNDADGEKNAGIEAA